MEELKTIASVINDEMMKRAIIMCEKYCKYHELFEKAKDDNEEEELMTKVCNDCPMLEFLLTVGGAEMKPLVIGSDIKIITHGRGRTFRRNVRKITDENGEPAIEIYGDPQNGLLGMIRQDNGITYPVLVTEDGYGEMVLDFEAETERGKYVRFDLRKLLNT